MALLWRQAINKCQCMRFRSQLTASTVTNLINIKRRNFTVSVEGNIGSGKTTMLEYFSKNPHVEVIKEPVDKWRCLDGGNLFELMYKDPKRWSYTFQTYTLLTMMHIHQKEQVTHHRLLERSAFSAVYVFVENLYLSGNISKLEYSIHHEWFDWIKKEHIQNIDLFVYIRTSPEECLRRVKARGRAEEEGLSLELLQQLHERYEEWLVEGTKFDILAPVLVIDGDNSIEEMIQKYYEKSESIFNPLEKNYVL
eukprot:gene19080-20996_t